MMRTRWLSVICVLAIAAPFAQQRSIDDFFRTISDDWVRMNPNLAVSTRYFSGDEQDRLEQQLSSYTEKAARRAQCVHQAGSRRSSRNSIAAA